MADLLWRLSSVGCVAGVALVLFQPSGGGILYTKYGRSAPMAAQFCRRGADRSPGGASPVDIAIIVLSVLLVLAAGVAIVLAYRITRLRSVGTPCLLRRIPAAADQGWRHGVVRYDEIGIAFYRLSTLRLGATVTLLRQSTEIVARRRPEGTEADILDGLVVLEVAPGADGRGGAFEMAMTQGAATAFQSWIEARQSARSQRRRA